MPVSFMGLQAGDWAPDFEAERSDGTRVSLADYRGRWLVLYFYPRDNTPGCTRQACAFREDFETLKGKGVEVLGVSTDSIASHRRFRARQKLPFDLLSDPEGKVVRSYGVWGPKTFMGRRFDGTHRVTFLIGPGGKIHRIVQGVKPEQHVQAVLEAVSTGPYEQG